MASALILAGLASALAVVAVGVLGRQREQEAEAERVRLRVERLARREGGLGPRRQDRHPVRLWIGDRLARAGFQHRPRLVAAMLLGGGLLCLGIGLVRGPWAGLAMLLGCAAAVAAWLGSRARKRRTRLLAQLPLFLDHVVRAVSTGSGVVPAIVTATGESEEPLRDVFVRVLRHAQLGESIDDALEEAGAAYRLRELDLLTLALRLNQRYGGSLRDMLASIVTMVRQRERIQREFGAMTGETRLSAWVLGSLPIGIALYIVAVNPEYLERMWSDSVGQTLLGVAVSLQAVGALLLWRLVRSV